MSIVWNMSNDRQITTAELAQAYGVTVRTISRWVATGRISPAVKFPGRTGGYLFSPDALPLQEDAA